MPEFSTISHIAIAVKNLDHSKKWIDLLDVVTTNDFVSTEQGLYIKEVVTRSVSYEFMQPIQSGASPVCGFLARNPRGGVHHICYRSEVLENSIQNSQALGVRKLGSGVSTSIHENRACFMNPADLAGVLVEFEEF